MKLNKLMRLSASGLMAITLSLSAVSPIFAAENEDVSLSDHPDTAVSSVLKQEEKADTAQDFADQKQTEQINEKADPKEKECMEQPPVAKADEFLIPEQVIASGKHGDLHWYLSQEGMLHLEDGDLLLDAEHGEHPFAPYTPQIKDICIENVHGLGKVRLIGKADALFLESSLKSFDGSLFDTSNCQSMNSMFYASRQLTSVDVSTWDTSSVTDLGGMFGSCTQLQEANLSGLNTCQVTDMSDMFYYCSALESLDLSSFNLGRTKDLSGMFSYCHCLKSLNLSALSAAEAENMSEMFRDCSSLSELDLSDFHAFQVRKADKLFYNCQSLRQLDLSGMSCKAIETMEQMFAGCTKLESVNLTGWDTLHVNSFDGMFAGTDSMKSLTFRKSFLNSEAFGPDCFPAGKICFEDEAQYPLIYQASQIKDLLIQSQSLMDEDAVTAYFCGSSSSMPLLFLEPNGGKGDPIGLRLRPSRLYLPDNPFSACDGKSFLGWNTKPDGSGTFYKNRAEITEDLVNKTLYAQWGSQKLYATSLRLGANLGVNFFFEMDRDTAENPNAAILIRSKDQQTVKSIPLSKAAVNTASVPGKTLYKVVELLPAVQFADTLEVWIQTDSFESVHTTFSVKEYARKVLVSSQYSPAMKKLVSSAVLYGSAAQTYFGYDTDHLASTGLLLNQEAAEFAGKICAEDLARFEPSVHGSFSNDAIRFGSAKTIFNPKASVKFCFESSYTPQEMAHVKVTWKNKELKIRKDTEPNAYYVLLENVEGLEANEPITLTIKDDRQEHVMTCTFGLHSDLFHSLSKNQTDHKTALQKSFYTFTHYIAQYLEK